MKTISFLCTMLFLFLLLERQEWLSSYLAFVLAFLPLFSGMVLNFSSAAPTLRWEAAGWGMFYGSLAFFVVCIVTILWILPNEICV